jgi:hypothetical protein
MRLSTRARLAALEKIRETADVPAGLTKFYGLQDEMSPQEWEQAVAVRRKIVAAAYPDFDVDTGEPLNDRGRYLLVRRL